MLRGYHPYNLAPQSGEREGPIAKQWDGEGPFDRFGFHFTFTAIRVGAGQQKVPGMPLTLPALRAGPLPLPASRGEVCR